MRYGYSCNGCGLAHTIERSIKEGPPETPPACPSCAHATERIWNTPEVLVEGKPIPFTKPAVNIARRYRTPQQQEKFYSRYIGKWKESMTKLKRQRGLSRSGEQNMRLVGKVPRELWVARTRQFGKQYWFDEGRKALKRDGLDFDSA